MEHTPLNYCGRCLPPVPVGVPADCTAAPKLKERDILHVFSDKEVQEMLRLVESSLTTRMDLVQQDEELGISEYRSDKDMVGVK